jgi:modulator of FtsH protease HflK
MSMDPNDLKAGKKPEPAPVPAVGGESGVTPPVAVEDAGTRALAEALRASFALVKLMTIGLVIAFIVSGIFTVNPNEVAVLLRFGRPVGVGTDQLLTPGLHWKLPYPVDEVVRIPVGESRTLTSTTGWYFVTPEEEASGTDPMRLPYLRPGVDGYVLTGDGNIVHVRATLSYRITDPLRYAFQFGQVTNLMQGILDNALIYAASRFSADDALYLNKLAFQETVLARVNLMVERLQVGVTVDPREVRTRPPLFVEDAFDNVLRAQQEGDLMIQEAQSYARGATNRAIGEASAVRSDGVTRSNYLVQTLSAEANSFEGLLPAYERDPNLFRQRLLAEYNGRVLTNAQMKTYVPQRPGGKPWEIRLQLNKEPEVPRREAPAER